LKPNSNLFHKNRTSDRRVFQAETQKYVRTDRQMMLIFRFQNFLHLNKNLIFKLNFLNFTKYFYISISVQGDGRTEKGTEIINRNSLIYYANTNALLIYRSPSNFLTSLRAVEPISHYCLPGQQSYICGPLADTIASIS